MTSTTNFINISGSDSQGVSSNQIKVGVLAPLSGVAGFLGTNEVNAVKAYFGEVDAAGGVKGHQLVPVIGDTGFDNTQESIEARQMVSQDKVFFLIALLGDTDAPYITSVGIPSTNFALSPPTFSSLYPTEYPLGFDDVTAVDEMAYQLTQIQKLPIKKVAIVYADQNIDIAPWKDYLAKDWEQFGVQVVNESDFNVSNGNCNQLVLQVKASGAQFWQAGQSLGWPLCIQAMAQENWHPQYGYGGPYTDDAAYINQAGEAGDGVVAITNDVYPNGPSAGQPYGFNGQNVAPALQQYLNDFKTYSASGDTQYGIESIWSQDFWTMSELIADSIYHQSGAITWKGVNQWIQAQTHWCGGLVSCNNFTPTCKSGAEDMWMFNWLNGGNGTLAMGPIGTYGGRHPLPASAENGVLPGSGDCFSTAVADAVLKK